MPPFLSSIGAALTANALKLGLGLLLLAGAAGGGFVWGDSHATGIAMQSASKDADARVAAAQKTTQALLAGYVTQISAQKNRGDGLAAALAKDENQLATDQAAAKETIAHAVPQNSACDIPVVALAVLRAQPARQ